MVATPSEYSYNKVVNGSLNVFSVIAVIQTGCRSQGLPSSFRKVSDFADYDSGRIYRAN